MHAHGPSLSSSSSPTTGPAVAIAAAAAPDVNEHGLAVGPRAAGAGAAAPWPGREALAGHSVSVVPLRPGHAASLYRALGGEANLWRWTYMLSGGWRDEAACAAEVRAWCASEDPQFYAVVKRRRGGGGGDDHDHDHGHDDHGHDDHGHDDDDEEEALGVASFMSVVPAHRRIEMGSIILGDGVRRSRAATEALALMMARAFSLGYTRLEWKGDALNGPSKRAARRLGFVSEGIFRCVRDEGGGYKWRSMADRRRWPLAGSTWSSRAGSGTRTT